MNCKLVISQPALDAPEGKPYGVTREGSSPEWFAKESQAWDRRDTLMDAGFRGVRVVGAACNAFAC